MTNFQTKFDKDLTHMFQLTLFLVLTNLFNEIPGTSPKVDGFSALTVWVLSCILFVFGALVGYAGILYRKMFAHKVIYLSFCLKNRSYCINLAMLGLLYSN